MENADYDRLMRANIVRVFGERDVAKRMTAISELYADDAAVYEPDHEAIGAEAISATVSNLLTTLPKEFVFSPIGPATGHHDVARLRWRAGIPDGPAAASGTDVAHFRAGRIQSLYVFLDPTVSKD
ncbi:nuclear transport factor 2 family protein [Bradyrhizobium sp. NBAIM03]|uniref:nuclear transport factor 2 family protein n=1 Tax=Bradyrhizobium sp. NBAIM03 TaxID=2793816 RepID=UPI001CD6560F|nr:nuclear transport factor 2 family protein [Bradyrhizobium sp. NBAIM03]MCA1536711.1 nuclear transport factor 2 family protein [Bradyrhizobium sp. NBAIM03]